MPPVDEDLIDTLIEQYWEYAVKDGTIGPQYQSMVVAVKKHGFNGMRSNFARDLMRMDKRLMKSKWKKNVVESFCVF